MNYRELYEKHEESIAKIEEVGKAEESLSAVLSKIKEINAELYFDLDSTIGTLARAYEKQGFRGGYEAARAIA